MLHHLGAITWKAVDNGTLLLELGFLVAMFSLHHFRWICAIAVFFHAGIHFSMDILFWENLMAYAMFVDWARVLPKGLVLWVQRTFTARSPGQAAVFSVFLGTVLTGVYSHFGNPMNAVMGFAGFAEWAWNSVVVGLLVLMAAIYLARVARAVLTMIMVKPVADPAHVESGPLVLFDGYCGLCDRFVDFVLRNDRKGVIRFAALQSDLGKKILQTNGISGDYVESVVFVYQGKTRLNSTAALSAIGLLGWPWRLAVVFLLVPPVLRDWVYDVIANNRYKWFGKHETCRLPTPAERGRFLA